MELIDQVLETSCLNQQMKELRNLSSSLAKVTSIVAVGSTVSTILSLAFDKRLL